MHAAPGRYAVLLGAGVSTQAGVPQAYEVQTDLIRSLMRMNGITESDDPINWFREKYDLEPSYDVLLSRLTSTQDERQALLRGYFETNSLTDQPLAPTDAHRALARLVSAGRIKIVLTTNFDRLMEAALAAEGIDPVVVSTTGAAESLFPLEGGRCLVVHVHGEYLHPGSMLNTPGELASYGDGMNRLLDRIFDEYGLVVAGWSARVDTALRDAIERCKTRRFTTTWVEPFSLSTPATDVIAVREAVVVQQTAEVFFASTADASAALAERAKPHPLEAPVAIATAKRYLGGEYTSVRLHDLLHVELGKISTLEPIANRNFQLVESSFATMRATVLDGTEISAGLVATLAYWGNDDTEQWWLPTIERLARPVRGFGGLTMFIDLVRSPATILIYAGGVGAAAAGHWDRVARILLAANTEFSYKKGSAPAALLLSPNEVLGGGGTRFIEEMLKPLVADELALGEEAFLDAWDRFEYLRHITRKLWATATQNSFSLGDTLVRVEGQLDQYMALPSPWLAHTPAALASLRLACDRFVDGDPVPVTNAIEAVDNDFNTWSNQVVWSRHANSAGGAVALPSGPWRPGSS